MSSSEPSSILHVASGTSDNSSAAARPRDAIGTLNDSTMTFISKIPNELLHKIFLTNGNEKYLKLEQYSLGHRAHAARENNTDNSQHARAASQVCRRWRQVALAASALWGQVLDTHTMPPLWFKEVLRRSGSAPLIVVSVSTRGPSHDPYSQANVRLLLQPDFVNRLQVFHVDSNDPAVINAAKDLSFPVLKRCSLKFPLSANLSGRHVGSLQLFGNQAPFLEHLQISGIIPRASSTIYSTLTSLHMYQSSLSPMMLLRILQQTPLLQEFSLGDSVTYPHRSGGPNTGITNLDLSSIPLVHLPFLKTLHVYQRFDACLVEVLSRIRPKAMESLCISAVGAFPGDLWDTLVNSAPKFLSPLQPSTASYPGLNHDAMTLYPAGFLIGPQNISLVQKNDPSVRPPGVEDPRLAIHLVMELRRHIGHGGPVDRDDIAKMLKPLFAAFTPSFSRCRFFTVRFREGDYSFDDHTLKLMLTSFAMVSVLHLSEMKFLGAILLASSLPVEDASVAMPTLKSSGNVDISQTSLSKLFLPSLQVLGIPQLAITDNATFAALTQMLTFRKLQNTQIRVIALSSLDQPGTGPNSVDLNGEEIKLYEERVQALTQDFGISVDPV